MPLTPYRARQAALRQARRESVGRGDRTAEYARQRERRATQRAIADGGTVASHPLLDAARAIAGRFRRPDRRESFYRPTYEDAVGEAAVALVADEDAEAAVQTFLKDERAWASHAVPMTVEFKSLDPEYVLCDHGYLRRGWCHDCI